MSRSILIILISLVLAAPASALTPHRKATEIVSYVAGKPVTVMCSDDMTEWNRITKVYRQGNTVYGLAVIRGNLVRLNPFICKALRSPFSIHLGFALNVLAHEAAHSAGIANESRAACWGLRYVMPVAELFYNIRPGSWEAGEVLDASRRLHNTLPRSYRQLCK